MTVTRRITITYEAETVGAAEPLEAMLQAMATSSYVWRLFGVSDVAFSSETVPPSPEPLVEPS